MSVKFLNLDEVVPEVTRTITFQKKKYTMKDMSLDDILDMVNSANEAQADGEMSETDFVATLRTQVAKAFPEMEADGAIGKMNLHQLMALLTFISEDPNKEDKPAPKGKKPAGKPRK